MQKRVALALVALYIVTLAPDVTFWDSGEMIAAGWTLGIPHPPGTPLIVVLLRSWAWILSPVLDPAAAMNLFSAVSVAVACALGSGLLARQTGDRAAAAAGGIAAGTMSTVWLNATETEVYGPALLLGVATVAAAWRYRETRRSGWLLLCAYLLVLAVPLHLSALLAAPAVVYTAWSTRGVGRRGKRGVDDRAAAFAGPLIILGASMLAIAAGRTSPEIAVVAMAVIGIAVWARSRGRVTSPLPAAWAVVGVSAVAISALAYLYLRAQHDPVINQGNPDSWRRLLAMLSREQYGEMSMWPRQAAPWLQLLNLLQYADWQVALSLGPDVMPSVWRTSAAVAFGAIAVSGSLAHRTAERDGWRAFSLLLLAGTIGAVGYLNLKAGPTLDIPGITDDLEREARERDYFFVLGFWSWGMWGGFGAVALARRLKAPLPAGLAVAALPLMLNFTAVDRAHLPEGRLARVFAVSLLESVPHDGVLFVSADNDTYPLWYAQQVHGVRADVTVVTIPLLAAGWYRDEMSRRYGLHEEKVPWRGIQDVATRIAERATQLGRPVAASITLDVAERTALAAGLHVPRGMVFVTPDAAPEEENLHVTRQIAAGIGSEIGGRRVRRSTDPISEYVASVLVCPEHVLQRRIREVPGSLDSTCNLR